VILFIKGKRYPEGTIREWKGKKYKKVNKKWIRQASGRRKPAEDDVEVKSHPMDTREALHKNTGKDEKPLQPVNDLHEVYKLVEASRAKFTSWTAAIADRFATMSPTIIARSELKSEARAARKITATEGAESILDIDGKTLVMDTEEDVIAIAKHLLTLPEVVRIKDRFKVPTDVGYRDFLINVKMPNGAIVELQLTTKALMQAKNVGHTFYEIGDQVESALKQGLIKNDVYEDIRHLVVEAQSKLYSIAHRAGREGAAFNAASFDSRTPLKSISTIFQESGAESKVSSEKSRKTFDSLMTTIRSSHSKYSKALGSFISRAPLSKSSIIRQKPVVNTIIGRKVIKLDTIDQKRSKTMLYLGKARPYPDGVIRSRGGKKVKKVDGGWVPVSEGMTASEKVEAEENNKLNKKNIIKLNRTRPVYDLLHKISSAAEPFYLDDLTKENKALFNSCTKDNLITWTHVAHDEYKAELTAAGQKAHDAGQAYFNKVRRESLTEADAPVDPQVFEAFRELFKVTKDTKGK